MLLVDRGPEQVSSGWLPVEPDTQSVASGGLSQ